MNIIETERLLLREWQPQDVEPFTKLNQDPKVLEYLPGPLTDEETADFIKMIKNHFSKHGFGLWATELKNTHKFIGYVGLNTPQFKAHFMPCIEIGWRLAAAYWGQGYATEAAKAVLNIGFEKYKLEEIVSFTVPENQRSRRVMEKIGMLRDKSGDFNHPKFPDDHALSKHVLYRSVR